MTSFDSGFWNLFIIVSTLGGIFALYLLVRMNGTAAPKSDDVETMGHVWDDDLAELNNPLPRWWVNMFYITLAFGLGYLMIYPGLGSNPMPLGWTQQGQYEAEVAAAEARYAPLFTQFEQTPIPELTKDPKALRMGERLYASYCTGCHGSDAAGVTGFPNLRDTDWLYGGTPEQIEQTILKGRHGIMPPWQAVLNDTGVQQMTNFVLSLSSGNEVSDHSDAKQKFAQLCAACHAADGTGNQALGAPNLTDAVWIYGGTSSAVSESIGRGRNGQMPAHENFLGTAKVHLLATYIWSLSNTD